MRARRSSDWQAAWRHCQSISVAPAAAVRVATTARQWRALCRISLDKGDSNRCCWRYGHSAFCSRDNVISGNNTLSLCTIKFSPHACCILREPHSRNLLQISSAVAGNRRSKAKVFDLRNIKTYILRESWICLCEDKTKRHSKDFKCVQKRTTSHLTPVSYTHLTLPTNREV